MCFLRCLALIAACVLSCSLALSAEELPRSSTHKIADTPDFNQWHEELQDGAYCVPTSMSNAFMWLGRNGYPRLIPQGGSDDERQLAMIKELAELMGTGPIGGGPKGGGTTGNGGGLGTLQYVMDREYTIRRYESHGFKAPPATATGSRILDWNWIKAAIHGNGAAWFVAGWCSYDAATDKYALDGAHMVTAVGYEETDDGLTVIIQNPSSPRFDGGFPFRLKKFQSGEITEKSGKPVISAVGQYGTEVVGGRCGVLQDTGVLELGPLSDRKILFNGRDLTGWTPLGLTGEGVNTRIRIIPSAWPVRRGSIVCDSNSSAILISGPKYGDFVLDVEVRLPEGAATGIIVRSEFPREKAFPFPFPLLDAKALREAVMKKPPPGPQAAILASIAAAIQPGKWNSVMIRYQGDHVRFAINSREIAEITSSQIPELRDVPKTGHIVLVNLDGVANGTAYRNLRIREL